MGKKISERVTWVGKIDWELKQFHGDELSTAHGSSYNAYLVRDTDMTVLIDTVCGPFDREFVARLSEEIELTKIDAIIMNHSEVDHSGALVELLRIIPNVPVYCTAKGEAILRGHYHEDWNFRRVKTGDTLSLGTQSLTFIEVPMLHWPDSMFTFMAGENILFSNDGFGQHYATENLYVDRVCMEEVMQEAEKYYVNILNPFSRLVTSKVKALQAMNLPITMICPGHGCIWRENPMQIVLKYLEWADAYQENQITLIYDTMWNATQAMAEAIADGIRQTDPEVTIKLCNAAKDDKNDILTEVFRSKAILVGSPTINNGFSYAIAGLLEMAKGLRFQNKKAAAFGSYGWSGEAVKQLTARLADSGFEVVNEGHRSLWRPDQNEVEACRSFGREFMTGIASA